MKRVSFKVGDEVICIRDHTEKIVRNGDVFRVKGLESNPCCGSIIVDVGVRSNRPYTKCYTCQCSYKKDDGNYWFAAMLFRKIQKGRKDKSDALPEELQERIERHREGVTTRPLVEV
jgi:hypothetical protein